MRKLSFEGFLKRYVVELSGAQTTNVHKLADCLCENPRMKEPLFLYALTFDKVNLLLRYTMNSKHSYGSEKIFREFRALPTIYVLTIGHLT